MADSLHLCMAPRGHRNSADGTARRIPCRRVRERHRGSISQSCSPTSAPMSPKSSHRQRSPPALGAGLPGSVPDSDRSGVFEYLNAGKRGATIDLVALLAALEHRRRTGEGQLIEVAQIEVAACVAAEPVIEYSMNASAQPREGNRCRGHVQGVYPTAVDDAWVALCVRDDADWAHMVEAMGRSICCATRDSRRRNNGDSPTMSSTLWLPIGREPKPR